MIFQSIQLTKYTRMYMYTYAKNLYYMIYVQKKKEILL